MKRSILILIAAVLSAVACEKPNKDSDIYNLYGNYKLSNIHWSGQAVNLNQDELSYWDLLYEFKDILGYCEQSYVATVDDAMKLSEKDSFSGAETAFSAILPYPKFVVSEGKWVCTQISSIGVTLRGDKENFRLNGNTCFLYPKYFDEDDFFLANIKDVSLFVESFDSNSFKIGVRCTLPHDENGAQELNENYLYYEFSR